MLKLRTNILQFIEKFDPNSYSSVSPYIATLHQITMCRDRIYEECKGILYPKSFSYFGCYNEGVRENFQGKEYIVDFKKDKDIQIELPFSDFPITQEKDFVKYIIDKFSSKIQFKKGEGKNRKKRGTKWGVGYDGATPYYLMYFIINVSDPSNLLTDPRNNVIIYAKNLFEGMFYAIVPTP